jgi:ketosteroid isomerase-like protein
MLLPNTQHEESMQLVHWFAAGLLITTSIAPSSSTRSTEDVAALIKRQSQEFSDASASGDSAAFDRLLDDSVIFMNETGVIATKKDLLAGAKPPQAGFKQKLVQTDYAMQLHGNVAVTSFTDNSTVEFNGQTSHAAYKSTEVWMKEKSGWRMISSQTLTVLADPPAAKLASNVLDEYVGTYKASDKFVFTIARDGEHLTGSVNDATPYPIAVELRDVLFTPGQPNMRRIFERDASGKITGFVVRRDGRDGLHLTRVS